MTLFLYQGGSGVRVVEVDIPDGTRLTPEAGGKKQEKKVKKKVSPRKKRNARAK